MTAAITAISAAMEYEETESTFRWDSLHPQSTI